LNTPLVDSFLDSGRLIRCINCSSPCPAFEVFSLVVFIIVGFKG